MNQFPLTRATRHGFITSAGVSAVLVFSLVSPNSPRTVLFDGLLQGTLDQSQLLSNLCLSILAMLTFLSKFYKWKECGNLFSLVDDSSDSESFYPGAMTGS